MSEGITPNQENSKKSTLIVLEYSLFVLLAGDAKMIIGNRH